MDEKSNRRGYQIGILIMMGILLFGYASNSIVEALGIVKMHWPQNLYFIILLSAIGVTLGIMSDSVSNKVTNIKVLLPSIIVLGSLAVLVFLKPNGYESIILNKLLATPALFLSVYIFVTGAAFVSAKLRFIKQTWANVLTMLTFLLFSYSTIIAQQDYYKLSMQIGEERALFEAEDDEGKFYRLPFAVKLLSSEEGVGTTMVRLFNTVEDFKDVALRGDNDYRLKGWIIKLEDESSNENEKYRLVGLNLVFDRWIELKYISLGLLIVCLIIRLKF
jgi:cation transporter-like permease